MEFSHDGRWLVSYAEDRSVRLWDTRTGRSVKRMDNSYPGDLLPPEAGPSPFTFSMDDEMFTVPNSPSGKIDVWTTSNPQRIASLPYDRLTLTGTTILPGNRLLLSSDVGGFLCLQEISSGDYIAREKGQLLGLHGLALSPDATRVAVGTASEGVRLWSADVKSELLVLEAKGEVCNLTFSQKGDSLVVGTYDWAAKNYTRLILYRAPSWEEIGALEAKQEIETMSE